MNELIYSQYLLQSIKTIRPRPLSPFPPESNDPIKHLTRTHQYSLIPTIRHPIDTQTGIILPSPPPKMHNRSQYNNSRDKPQETMTGYVSAHFRETS